MKLRNYLKNMAAKHRGLQTPAWSECQRVTPELLQEIEKDLDWLCKGRRSKKEIINKPS